MPDEESVDPDKRNTSLIRLRQRLLDLQKMGGLEPAEFGTFQQTLMQIYQESERRRQSCMGQAESLKRQAAGAESQAHAFSAISSILYNIVDGQIGIEQKRLNEEKERQMREDGELPTHSASGASYEDEGEGEEKTATKKKKAGSRVRRADR